MEMKEEYKIVGLKENTSLREVNRSFLKFVVNYNPDKDRERFDKIYNAHIFLRDNLMSIQATTKKNLLTFKLGEVMSRIRLK